MAAENPTGVEVLTALNTRLSVIRRVLDDENTTLAAQLDALSELAAIRRILSGVLPPSQ